MNPVSGIEIVSSMNLSWWHLRLRASIVNCAFESTGNFADAQSAGLAGLAEQARVQIKGKPLPPQPSWMVQGRHRIDDGLA
jgi:hypothetical protein